MLKKQEGVTLSEKEGKSESAGSFQVEFLNTKSEEITSAMSGIGNFVFISSGPEGENSVYFKGERSDGTKIRIIIEKGQNYKSPKEIADEATTKEEE